MSIGDEIFNLAGRTALITGGGTGIGKLSATTLAAAGARVVLCGRRLAPLQQACAEIEQAGGRAFCIQMDVADAAGVTAGFAEAAQYGPITIVLNNAGLSFEHSLLDMPEQDWDLLHDVNLKGAWLVAKAAVQQLIASDVGGSIINVASVLGSSAQKGTGPYGAFKAGLVHLTRNMALEWARYGVRVNTLSPGYYATDMTAGFIHSEWGAQLVKRIPQRRLGELPDLAGAVLLLASDASAYMTGSEINVDGGLSLSVI